MLTQEQKNEGGNNMELRIQSVNFDATLLNIERR